VQGGSAMITAQEVEDRLGSAAVLMRLTEAMEMAIQIDTDLDPGIGEILKPVIDHLAKDSAIGYRLAERFVWHEAIERAHANDV